MATMMRDLLTVGGNHKISNVMTIWAKPVVNAAIATVNLDNGVLVEEDGYTDDGVLKVKPWEGTKPAFIVQTVEEEQLLTDLGERDYKCFYNKAGEPLRLFRVETGIRQESSNYTVKGGATPKLGAEVCYNTADKTFCIGETAGSGIISVGKLVGIETDFGFNAGTTTYAVEYK